ncbi:MAG: amidohydrolase [Cyclobacteriaceae bacterium]
MRQIFLVTVIVCSFFSALQAQTNSKLQSKIDQMAKAIEPKLIEWRRHFHQYPELSNREKNTAAKIAEHLRSLGIEVQTGVAHTGVVGLLKGAKPGPVIALRADMDALPVTERNDLAFASKERTTFNDQEVGVMHACGHDTHMAILMGVAEILSSLKKDLKGTVKFIFQPAEEGSPKGEEGGAELMVKEGVLENPKPDVIFGLHISSQTELGKITYRPGGLMASVNDMKIIVRGRQAHGAAPWSSIDPIVVSAQIINNLQTIISRNLDITENAGVVTIGSIHGGVRSNIIPEQVEMLGTLRALSTADEKLLIDRVKQIATKTAEASGATAEVEIPYSSHYPVTFNDVALTEKMVPSLKKAAGDGNVMVIAPHTGAEDFSFFQEKIPGLFFFVGALPPDIDAAKAPSHHTPDFMIDERGMLTGLKAMLQLTLDYGEMK